MSATPPKRGTRIAHIGLATESIQAILPLYRDLLEMPEVEIDDSDGARISALAAGDALIEFLQPEEPGSPIAKFLARRGPGIHHICFAVDDLDGTLARFRAAGLRPIDERPRVGAEGKRIAFIHPSGTNGVLVELSEY